MSLRRLSVSSMRSVRARGDHFWGQYPGGSYWSEGTQPAKGAGHLFGESPLKPGQKRVREDWELPWIVCMFIAPAVVLGVGLNVKPETRLTAWAREEAERRLAAE
mmetsp:Transcript_33843/g.46855  ORF Transcript_33843/g.46855 Transcript_33843/m.46855 type:complete len:105 (+) Transcript_33843:127-441(+)|eukprot:CAMPEP_0196587346 /NCGR_PEP_ID=MMETSP1081-20130531/57211_1 /TAXON_ID=36882 /ORGANISM="Pyramimonas amylifera, Strain CCMP720" /LENGTH=104 /DNA_ID=CAMNT_0041909517 /DNA_START=127 /DNA_END=441 /DNA_ORIENTATION=-